MGTVRDGRRLLPREYSHASSLAASIALKTGRVDMKVTIAIVMLSVSISAAWAHNKSLRDYRAMMSDNVTTGIGSGAKSKKVKGTPNPAADDSQNHLTR